MIDNLDDKRNKGWKETAQNHYLSYYKRTLNRNKKIIGANMLQRIINKSHLTLVKDNKMAFKFKSSDP